MASFRQTLQLELSEYYKDLVLSTSVDREAKVSSGICGYSSLTYHKAVS